MKKLALFGTLIFALSGCSYFSGGSSDSMEGGADAAAAASAIEAAENAIKMAKKAGGEWRDSDGKFLKKAKDAASKKDYAGAIKLAEKAKFEGEMGLEQAKAQANAKPWLF